MGRIEVITRTERRRKYSPAERGAIMREADAPDVTVREVAKRHDIAESLIYSLPYSRGSVVAGMSIWAGVFGMNEARVITAANLAQEIDGLQG